jgi:hypothetical protein
MVVPVVHRRLLLGSWHCCVNEIRISYSWLCLFTCLWSRFSLNRTCFSSAFIFLFVIHVMQMPRDKHILSSKFLILLFIRPHVNQYLASYLDYPKHFTDSLDSEGVSWKVVDHCDRNYSVKAVTPQGQLQGISPEDLVVFVLLSGLAHEI